MVFVGILVYKSRVNCDYETNAQLIRDMNIKLLTYTEDNKLVAYNKGKLLGSIYKERDIISGIELRNMTKDEMERNIEGYKVLSKVTKDQMEYIVKELKNKKYNTYKHYKKHKTCIEFFLGSFCSFNNIRYCNNIFICIKKCKKGIKNLTYRVN